MQYTNTFVRCEAFWWSFFPFFFFRFLPTSSFACRCCCFTAWAFQYRAEWMLLPSDRLQWHILPLSAQSRVTVGSRRAFLSFRTADSAFARRGRTKQIASMSEYNGVDFSQQIRLTVATQRTEIPKMSNDHMWTECSSLKHLQSDIYNSLLLTTLQLLYDPECPNNDSLHEFCYSCQTEAHGLLLQSIYGTSNSAWIKMSRKVLHRAKVEKNYNNKNVCDARTVECTRVHRTSNNRHPFQQIFLQLL